MSGCFRLLIALVFGVLAQVAAACELPRDVVTLMEDVRAATQGGSTVSGGQMASIQQQIRDLDRDALVTAANETGGPTLFIGAVRFLNQADVVMQARSSVVEGELARRFAALDSKFKSACAASDTAEVDGEADASAAGDDEGLWAMCAWVTEMAQKDETWLITGFVLLLAGFGAWGAVMHVRREILPRQSQRFSCSIPAELRFLDQRIPGRISVLGMRRFKFRFDDVGSDGTALEIPSGLICTLKAGGQILACHADELGEGVAKFGFVKRINPPTQEALLGASSKPPIRRAASMSEGFSLG